MKVAIVTHFPKDPLAPQGGVEAVSVNLVRSLSRFEDLDIHVVTATKGEEGPITQIQWQGATVHYVPGQQGSMLHYATGPGRRKISAYLKKLSPDIVHAHDTYGIMVKGLSIPRVFTIHGFIYGDTLISGRRFAVFWAWIWKQVETSSWADQPNVISISPYVRERLTGITKGRISDIDNPIDASFFQIKKEKGRKIVFCAAVICPRKNTLILVKAFSKVIKAGCEAELRLAGDVIDPGYGQAVRDMIRDCDLEKNVTLLGRINSVQVKAELGRSSVFALVSLEENSPMGIEEAMAASLPVVTSNRCGMPYMVREGESGFLVDPDNSSEIADRLLRILEDDTLCEEMGNVSRKIALDRFHPEVVAKRTRAVYCDIVRRVSSSS